MVLHEVLTTEKVPFSYQVAGLGSRLLAWLVDLGIILGLTFVGLVIGAVFGIGREGLMLAVVAMWTFVLQWGYFILFEWLWHGQTPGKRLLGIRVINRKGTSISFLEACVRNILRVVDGLPLTAVIPDLLPLLYGVGFAVAVWNRENLRLGDLAAGTLVVHLQHKTRLLRPVSERDLWSDHFPEAVARQRLDQLTRQQKQTVLELSLRREQLSVRDRTRLFEAMADYFQNRLGLVPQEFQSAEKFVVRLAGILSAGVADATASGSRVPALLEPLSPVSSP